VIFVIFQTLVYCTCGLLLYQIVPHARAQARQ